MKKRAFSLLLCLVLLLCIASCPAAADEAQTAETSAFDPGLAGAWSRDKTEVNGSVSSTLLGMVNEIRFFLPDGTASFQDLPFSDIAAAGLTAPKAIASDGELDLFNPLVRGLTGMLEKQPMLFDEAERTAIEKELQTVTDVKVSYELFDIPAEGYSYYVPTDQTKALFEKETADGLKIHITATVFEGPLTRKLYDKTAYYHRDNTSSIASEYMSALLTGSWMDSLGNKWEFKFENRAEEPDDSDPVLVYTLTTPGGETYFSSKEISSWSDPGDAALLGSISFYFEGFSAIFTIESISLNEIVLSDEVGSVTMTRS